MSPESHLRRHGRPLVVRAALLGLSFAVVGLAALPSRVDRRPPAEFRVRVTFGLRDTEPTDWSGKASVANGELTSLTGWRFDERDKLVGTDAWDCQTHTYPHARRVAARRGEQPTGQPSADEAWPNGITLVIRGQAPSVTLRFEQGEIGCRPAELALGEPQTALDGQVRIQLLPTSERVRPPAEGPTEGARQDDYPALWIARGTGRQYLAWVCYRDRQDKVLMSERPDGDSPWSDPTDVAGPGDIFRVALAEAGEKLWVVWSAQRNGHWNLYGKAVSAGKCGPEMKLAGGQEPNIWHRMTTDIRGRAWLVWQRFRPDGRSRIEARCADDNGWHEPVEVSTGSANNWDPAIAADPSSDRVWVGWDTYEPGSFRVRVRSLTGGPAPRLGDVLEPSPSPRFQAHACLACDGAGRLWAAWDESGPQWGKDDGLFYPETGATRLYDRRWIGLRCWDGKRWQTPAAQLVDALPPEMRLYHELPEMHFDGQDRLWLAFRHRTTKLQRPDGWANQGRWDVFATALLGDHWLFPTELPDSAGRNDMRAASGLGRDGTVYVAYASDNRPWIPPQMPPRNLSISVARLESTRPLPGMHLVETQAPTTLVEPLVHLREAEQVARARGYVADVGGKRLHLYRGDLHRHTDISQDGMGDGSLMDLYRYGLDAAALDFLIVSDHNMGHDNEYCWWRTQQSNDLYHVAGRFVPLYGYERSVPYPNGHRNVIWTERGHRTLKLPLLVNRAQMEKDTRNLYQYLRETNGICTSHTSATQQGTDWEEHDDALEPFVEIFQGFQGSYEMADAPKAVGPQTPQVHGPLRPSGYVVNGLKKGYRLGFQASSDHISTHVSYACIWAEDLTRKALVEGMKKRHTYGATDNIVLDVRMGSLGMMGDEVRTDRPALDVVAFGTGEIDRIDIIRDGEVVTSIPGKGRDELRFHWDDPSPHRGETPSYYYTRVLQTDGQMAWGSPIWVVGR